MDVDTTIATPVPDVPFFDSSFSSPQQYPQQPQQMQQQQLPPQELLGFIVPGGPVNTNFVPADGTGTKFTMQLSCPGDLPSPLGTVNELVFFLLPNAMTLLASNKGILCYWQISGTPTPTSTVAGLPVPSTGFELLGALTPSTPSAVFRTAWSENEEVVNILTNNNASTSSSTNLPVIVTIGISIEPLDTIQNIIGSGNVVVGATSPTSNNNSILNMNAAANQQRESNRLLVAQKIATDLFHYMQSFDHSNGNSSGNMLVPNNIFDRWMKRFEARFRRDPNFFLKTTE